jgi:hypothetical protein
MAIGLTLKDAGSNLIVFLMFYLLLVIQIAEFQSSVLIIYVRRAMFCVALAIHVVERQRLLC